MGDYELRKDIDRFKHFLDVLEVELKNQGVTSLNLMEMFGKFYDKSEVDVSNAILNADLEILSDDLIEFKTTLLNLKGNLVSFNQELIDFDSDNTNLAEDLSKLKNNLHLFTSATKKLSQDLSALDTKLDEFDGDIFGEGGLDSQLSNLTTVVGDNNSGLVKGLADLDNNLTQLNDDVFGEGGLDEQLTNLDGTINNPSTGLSAQLNGLDTRVFGSGGLSDSIFGANGLATRITTAEGGLSKLNSSLDILASYLTQFEDELEEFEQELDNDPNIDTSQLNSTIVTLFGAIRAVQGNVDTTQTQLDGVSDSFDGVKSNLYGTKVVDGETVPKEPTDTADATSLRGHLTTLKDTTVPAVEGALFGSNGTPQSPEANSTMGKIDSVKTDLYGSGTASNPQTGSLKNNLNTLKDTTVPAVQTALYGNGTPSNPATDSTMGKINTVKNDMYGNGTASNPQAGSLKDVINTVDDDINNPSTGLIARADAVDDTIGEVGVGGVLDDIDKAQTNVDNLQKTMYKGASGTGTTTNPANNTLMKDVNTAVEQIGDTSTSGTILYDIDKVQTDIGSVEASANGDLQSQILTIMKLFEGLIPVFDTVEEMRGSDYVGTGIVSTGDYSAPLAPGVDYVYETSTNKLYERQYLLTQYPLGYYGEWVHISQLPSENVRFPFTQIYDLINQFFAPLSHTHTKSEITDFTHTHTLSEISDLTRSSETAFPFSSNATNYSTANPVKITKWGRVMTVSGIGKLSTSVSANGDVVIGTMTSYLPAQDIYTTWTGINKQGFIKIATDGTVTLSNRNGTSTSMNNGEYFVFNCSYMI